MITRYTGIFIGLLNVFAALAQGGDAQVRTKADALFNEERFAEAMPLYSQLISLDPSDHQLNYHYGTCVLFGGNDRSKAIGYLKYAVSDPSIPAAAWYWLGRAYHLNYLFNDAIQAYERFRSMADKKLLATKPVDPLIRQCQNGSKLLSNLKEIEVRNKVEVDREEFFRFYDLSDIGGRIVVMPEELKTNLDKKRNEFSLIYLPDGNGPIYFSSFGKDGKTGKDIYRTELLPTGSFATPVKIPGYINTDQDEDFPFLHPDGKTFYFSSKGHNSMGGYDVFRATYDARSDAFGRPENLDFAVNTPDDDLLYIVDPEHKEACFASARSSSQGKVHVYRVSTSQVPLVITVLQGTYSSEFDASDKKARIVVEDALSRERITEVQTAKDGSYVLALPRSGRFRFLVECGPSGKTHVGIVDVPRNDSPKAYAQELALTRNADQEKLVIRNFFDRPLEGDLIALALDEIRRRAALDVSGVRAVAQQEEEHFDVITRAGFTGEHDKESVVRLAEDDARELDVKAKDLDVQARSSFALALEAVAVAEQLAGEAEAIATKAMLVENEEERHRKMMEAADLRDDSQVAASKARIAHQAGRDLEAQQLAMQQSANSASKLALDIRTTLENGPENEAVKHLVVLKQRADLKARPEQDPDPVLRAERAMLEKEKITKSALQKAKNSRLDEQDLQTRISKLERERTSAKGKRVEEIDRELTSYRQDIEHIKKESADLYKVAADHEKELFILRGDLALKRHLATITEPATLDPGELTKLADRIATTTSKIEAMHVDQRFVAHVPETDEERAARVFEWEIPVTVDLSNERKATQAADRSSSGDAESTGTRTTTVPIGSSKEAIPEDADVASVPVSDDGGTTDRTAQDAENDLGNTSDQIADDPEFAGDLPDGSGDLTTNENTLSRTPELTPEQVRRSEDPVRELPRNTGNNSIDAATERFLLENELAEIQQIQQAEKDPARRDSLQRRKEQVSAELKKADEQAAQTLAEIEAATGDDLWEPVDLERVPMVFNRDTKEEELIGELFSEYYDHHTNLDRLADADERAAGLYGLELMLSDSLRSEMARQLMVLELDVQQADRILPRVERLRQIRESHMEQAEQYLQTRQDEIAALTGSSNAADTADGDDPDSVAGTKERIAAPLPPADPLNDRFIHMHTDPLMIYHSEIHHRSPDVSEGLAMKEADLVRMDALTRQIDSALIVMTTIKKEKEIDKIRKSTDRLIDDRLITRTELGQRSAHLTREEWRTANDSVRTLQREITLLGLPANEPVMAMARDIRNEALKTFDDAGRVRKTADRTQDIIVRDSLYRKAYSLELEALRELDRSITAQNYIISGSHVPGENITYQELAARVFALDGPIAEEQVLPISTEDASTGTDEPLAVSGSVNEPLPIDTIGTVPAQTDQRSGSAESIAESTGDRASENDVAAKVAAARELAIQQISEVEERTPAELRKAPHTYERALAEEPEVMDPLRIEPVEDPELMRKLVVSTLEEATALERKARGTAEQAKAIEDSAATVNKRDRVKLEELATRMSQLSDSLQSASILKAQEARELELHERNALLNDKVYRRLVKYYYLDAEEVSLVMQDQDLSRYLQLKARALEQNEAAEEATEAARMARVSLADLKRRAQAAEDEARNGRLTAVEAVERARVMNQRADMLEIRADSLTDVSARLKSAAALSEDKASTMLQNMDEVSAGRSIALEARARRAGSGEEDGPIVPVPQIMNDDLSELPVLKSDTLDRPAVPTPERIESSGVEQQPIADVTQGNTEQGSRVVKEDSVGSDASARNSTKLVREEHAPVVEVPSTPTTPEATDTRAVEVLPTPTPVGRGRFTIPKKLVGDIFELKAEGEKREQPIMMNEELPEGIIYKVQIGAFRNQIPMGTFSDMTPVMGEDAGNGLTRYTAGLFSSFDQAFRAKDQVRDRGYRDAFVVAYLNGQRISLGEAMKATRDGGIAPEIAQAEPTTRTAATEGSTRTSDRVREEQSEGTRTAPTDRPRSDQGRISETTRDIPVDSTPDDRAGRLDPAREARLQYDNEQATAAEQDTVRDQRGADDASHVPASGNVQEPTTPAQEHIREEPTPREKSTGTSEAATQEPAQRAEPTPVPPAAAAVIPTLTPEEEARQILEKYPQTPEEIIAQFSPASAATNYYPTTGAAPARPVEMIMGLFFTVQVGVYTKPVALEKLYSITPLVSELTETEKIRYSTGLYTDMEKARERRLQIIDLGVQDAFITAYLNGNRIPIRDANALLEEHGPSILAKP